MRVRISATDETILNLQDFPLLFLKTFSENDRKTIFVYCKRQRVYIGNICQELCKFSILSSVETQWKSMKLEIYHCFVSYIHILIFTVLA